MSRYLQAANLFYRSSPSMKRSFASLLNSFSGLATAPQVAPLRASSGLRDLADNMVTTTGFSWPNNVTPFAPLIDASDAGIAFGGGTLGLASWPQLCFILADGGNPPEGAVPGVAAAPGQIAAFRAALAPTTYAGDAANDPLSALLEYVTANAGSLPT